MDKKDEPLRIPTQQVQHLNFHPESSIDSPPFTFNNLKKLQTRYDTVEHFLIVYIYHDRSNY